MSEPFSEKKEEKNGEVILVGAGCGRGLITVAGLKAVQTAEVLVYDDLIDGDLLGEAPKDCRKIHVGKRSGLHSMKQEKINEILEREAQAGNRVVRLKGGDSFVFGRGGEEFLSLRAAGIPCRLIPGVTSSVAVPEEMGIPVTHRGIAQSFTVVTGHTASDTEESYEALAKLKGTLVFLMGIHSIPAITEKLQRYGKAAETPAAVLSRGFTAYEQRIDGTLGTIAALAEGVPTPGILVVGPTAGMDLRIPEEGALKGAAVTVAGTPVFTEKMASRLEAEGASAERRPCMCVIPMAENIPNVLSGYQWIVFTSTNGVEIFFDHIRKTGCDLRRLVNTKFACIGKGTADQLKKHCINADLVPSKYTAETLGRELGRKMKQGEKALILRAEAGSKLLTEELDRANADYEDIPTYRTAVGLPADGGVCASGHYAVFGSAGCVRAWFSGNTVSEHTKAVCIGEFTAAEYRKTTGREPLVAETYTAEGITQVILDDWKKKSAGN